MSEDIKRVFMMLVDQPVSRVQGGLSVVSLSTRLDIEPRRTLKIVRMLERSGYVHVRRFDRVKLVTPTRLGYAKAASWRQTERVKPALTPTLTLFRIVGAGLLALLLLCAWWWLEPFPQTRGLRPGSVALLPSATAHPSETVVPTPSATATHAPTATALPAPISTVKLEGSGPLPTTIFDGTPEPDGSSIQTPGIPTPVPLLEQAEDTVNILLMGADTSGGGWRTDTLVVVSVFRDPPSVSILSIPRDLYVYVPGWQMGRINTVDFHGERVGYPGGGAGLVKATIEYNLGIQVHYFARVDFQGFVNILDTLGGVEIAVDCELHDTFPDPDAPTGASDIDLLPGVHHLDAKWALWYARSRWATNDFDRGRRQQRVLRGAFRQIKQLGLLAKLPELWGDLTQAVQTDLSLDTALWLASVAGRMEAGTAIKSRFIDFTVVEEWNTAEGAAVLLPVYERINPLIAEALAPPDSARSRQDLVRVEVLNGTTWPDWAVLAADRLLWEGFQVVSVGQADRTDYQRTLVMEMLETAKGSPVSRIARILRVDDANILPAETSAGRSSAPAPEEGAEGPEVDVRVVVGYDYVPCYKSYWRNVHGATN
jgi:LCP family protein required for cell wall assembly